MAIIALRRINQTGERGAIWAWTAIAAFVGFTVWAFFNTNGVST